MWCHHHKRHNDWCYLDKYVAFSPYLLLFSFISLSRLNLVSFCTFFSFLFQFTKCISFTITKNNTKHSFFHLEERLDISMINNKVCTESKCRYNFVLKLWFAHVVEDTYRHKSDAWYRHLMFCENYPYNMEY